MQSPDDDRPFQAQDMNSLILSGDLSSVPIGDLPGVVVLVSETGGLLNCNHLFESVSGYAKAEVLTMSATDLFPREEKPLVSERFRQALADGEANVEVHLMTKDGRLVPIYFSGRRKIIAGKPVLVCLGIKITDRKRLEELASFRAYLLDSVADAVASCDEKFNLVAWNRAAEEMYGISEAEALGRNVMQVTQSSIDDGQLKELLQSLAQTGKGRLQTVHHRLDGSPFQVDIRFSAVTGGFARYISVIRDITERVEAETEKERLIAELTQALNRVKTLGGLLPICSSCKKIRDDDGYWQQVEVYVQDHSDADFTHGLCPECVEKTRDEYLRSTDLSERETEPQS